MRGERYTWQLPYPSTFQCCFTLLVDKKIIADKHPINIVRLSLLGIFLAVCLAHITATDVYLLMP